MPSQEFSVDCSIPAGDGIINVANFEAYLRDRVKVGGKTNNLGEVISIKSDDTKVTLTSEAAFSKRYLKYLTKKFLKKNELKDHMRPISTDKATYTLKYYTQPEDEEEE